jgi:hypothetical protein
MKVVLHAELIPETEAEAGAMLMLDQEAVLAHVRRDLRQAVAVLVKATGPTPGSRVDTEYRLRTHLNPPR